MCWATGKNSAPDDNCSPALWSVNTYMFLNIGRSFSIFFHFLLIFDSCASYFFSFRIHHNIFWRMLRYHRVRKEIFFVYSGAG